MTPRPDLLESGLRGASPDSRKITGPEEKKPATYLRSEHAAVDPAINKLSFVFFMPDLPQINITGRAIMKENILTGRAQS
jgi:hypothetical protein